MAFAVAPEWIRTGQISLMTALGNLSRLVAVMFCVSIWITLPWNPVPTADERQRRALRRVILGAATTALACWLNPGHAWPIVVQASLNLAAVTKFRQYAGRTDPWREHSSINS